MSAATKNRPTSTKLVRNIGLPVKASTKCIGGTLGASDGDGLAVPATKATGLKVWGKFVATCDNSSGSNGDVRAVIEFGREIEVMLFANDAGTPVTSADVGTDCYALDNQTVTGDSTGASKAGTVYEVTSEGVWIFPNL